MGSWKGGAEVKGSRREEEKKDAREKTPIWSRRTDGRSDLAAALTIRQRRRRWRQQKQRRQLALGERQVIDGELDD